MTTMGKSRIPRSPFACSLRRRGPVPCACAHRSHCADPSGTVSSAGCDYGGNVSIANPTARARGVGAAGAGIAGPRSVVRDHPLYRQSENLGERSRHYRLSGLIDGAAPPKLLSQMIQALEVTRAMAPSRRREPKRRRSMTARPRVRSSLPNQWPMVQTSATLHTPREL